MNPKRESPLTYEVREHGAFLSTRATGITARTAMEAQLRDSEANASMLHIDFTGVAAMTNSFVDEFLGKFFLAVAAGDTPIAGVELAGLTDETRDAVIVALERRRQFAVDGTTHELLGDAEVLADTYDWARKLGSFRASAMADHLGISLPNANNRLKRLVDAGALRRDRISTPERGGKEFTYRLPDMITS